MVLDLHLAAGCLWILIERVIAFRQLVDKVNQRLRPSATSWHNADHNADSAYKPRERRLSPCRRRA